MGADSFVVFLVSSLFCFNNFIKLFFSSLGFINPGSFLFFFTELFLFCDDVGFKCSRLIVITFFFGSVFDSVIYFFIIILLVLFVNIYIINKYCLIDIIFIT